MGSLMAIESGGIVFFQFPFWHAALRAYTTEQLVSQPSGRPAVPGVVYDEFFITVSGDPGLVSQFFNGTNAMQNALPGRP